MTEVIFLVIGLLMGGGVVWFILRNIFKDNFKIIQQQLKTKEEEISNLRKLYDEEKINRVSFETQLKEAEKNLQEQKKILDEATAKLSDTFSALSKDALNTNNQMFLELAKANLEKIISEMKGDFSKKQEAISNIVKPLQEMLGKYEQQIRSLEESRQKAYGSLENQLKNLIETHRILQKETSNLVTALRTPQVRGRWGEITLRRVVELSGMSSYCDFTEQSSIEMEEGRLRPDMIVHLPNQRTIVVDSKVPLQAYIDAISASDEQERLAHMRKHASQVAEHMRKLSKKAYWDQFEKTPDFVVMFIPGESFFSAALETNKNLIEEGVRNRVFLATPTTLIALLRTVAYGWRQEQITKNALKIRDLGNTIHERLVRFIENFSKIGKSLEGAIDAYNRSVGTLESRVLVTARKFKELGITEKEPLKEVEQIEKFPRTIENISDPEEDNEEGFPSL
ncbi:DNA recombination protein RmuC [bacterium]|nr:DNA recombination protein RmuC [bacterium]